MFKTLEWNRFESVIGGTLVRNKTTRLTNCSSVRVSFEKRLYVKVCSL
jgi:hypothetical protein